MHPMGAGNRIIAHVCNNRGVWGRGFVLAVSRRWPAARIAYQRWYRTGTLDGRPFQLGEVTFVKVEEEIYVANIIGQQGIRGPANRTPIRYGAVEEALKLVRPIGLELKASIHMPRIGCGLAGGAWDKMEPIIERTLTPLSVTVYDLPACSSL